jgi:integrase
VSLRTYAFPTIGDLDVASIETSDILRVIEPHWNDRAVTMDRLRARIANVLDWCVVRGYRERGTNPASWRGHLEYSLPAARAVAPVRHFSAMPYQELPALMARLREQQGVAPRALMFLILCAARSNEVLGARRDEVDLQNAVWVVPPSRMKGRREHRVPLSDAAIKLLRDLPVEDGNPFLFIGERSPRLNSMALRNTLRRLHRDIMVDGDRSGSHSLRWRLNAGASDSSGGSTVYKHQKLIYSAPRAVVGQPPVTGQPDGF